MFSLTVLIPQMIRNTDVREIRILTIKRIISFILLSICLFNMITYEIICCVKGKPASESHCHSTGASPVRHSHQQVCSQSVPLLAFLRFPRYYRLLRSQSIVWCKSKKKRQKCQTCGRFSFLNFGYTSTTLLCSIFSCVQQLIFLCIPVNFFTHSPKSMVSCVHSIFLSAPFFVFSNDLTKFFYLSERI